ncbi:hypothetical protein EUBVEN_00580 [Eubacterium ventriosum ATCC 27560]|uniref:Uncharacterized protein n=1 Tax=Eubacterium ventriosum ATCC 27560 TaxID=411463 RepID=A5Z4F5_9FIRM|nr:hypothetical protein EUBVEN_00580 [Eubacterium ventriosum ATCC 27560]
MKLTVFFFLLLKVVNKFILSLTVTLFYIVIKCAYMS